MSVGNQSGVVDAVRVDVRTFHETWMELLYPRQRDAGNTVLGKWQPTTTRERVTYRGWWLLGVPVVAILYPLALFGVVVRFHARRIDTSVERLGAIGAVLLAVLVWGGLAALVEFRLDFPVDEANAIVGASVIAVLATALAVLFRSRGGRAVTVLLAYPCAMTAIFLPPVVAALLSEQVAQVVIPYSDAVARFILGDVLARVGLESFFVENFEREGFAYVVMWVGISAPIGWLLGSMVALADFIRPAE
jgi:hypothetical protein